MPRKSDKFISENKLDFPIQNLYKLQNDPNADTYLIEEKVSKNLIYYIENDKNDNLLSLRVKLAFLFFEIF